MSSKLAHSTSYLNIRNPRVLRYLTVLVVVMGVLIILGTAVVVVTIANRLIDSNNPAAAAADIRVPADQRAAVAATFGTVPVDLPPGTMVISVIADDGRLYLEAVSEAGDTSILVIDGASGKYLGTIMPRQTEKPDDN